MDELPKLVIGVSTAITNTKRRNAIRNSWLRYLRDDTALLDADARRRVTVKFIVSRDPSLEAEQEAHGDLHQLSAKEGYEHLWRKALTFLAELEALGQPYTYFMHADDDSFLRLDLLLPLLDGSPRERFYWGYIWDGTAGRATQPIRNPRYKSYMPEEQYASDFYPPFASGCGFVLSRDLVHALLLRNLPDYRLLDPPFGIHLCHAGPQCVVSPPVVPVHDERVRPYRPLPTFRANTVVQHYLKPEEMGPFFKQATSEPQVADEACEGPAAHLYGDLVRLGIWRR